MGVMMVFLAWTSSKVLYVLKVMKKIVNKIIYQMCSIAIMRKILVDNLYSKLVSFSRDH
jgi:hypothetical protein